MQRVRFEWGTQEFCDELLEMVCPTLFNRGAEARLWFANEMRVGLSPEFSYALNRAFGETDMRPVLPAIKAPTLVFYREGSIEAEQHREVAARIEGAHEVQLSGSDYWGIFLSPEIVDEIEQFVGGRPIAAVPDSVLATVLFTDIVGSTERAAELGDRGWRDAARAAPRRSCAGSWRAFAARRRTPRATASSPRSTAPRGRSAARNP